MGPFLHHLLLLLLYLLLHLLPLHLQFLLLPVQLVLLLLLCPRLSLSMHDLQPPGAQMHQVDNPTAAASDSTHTQPHCVSLFQAAAHQTPCEQHHTAAAAARQLSGPHPQTTPWQP
jgi:hypothetical protein